MLLPPGFTALDYAVIVPLMVLAAGVPWLLGGNRLWVMMPSVLLTFIAAILFTYRFLLSSYRRHLIVPPGGWAAIAFVVYLGLHVFVAEIHYEAVQEAFRFVGYLLAYWMWVNLLRVNNRWRWALMIVMLSVSLMAWYAMIQDAQGTRMAVIAERHADYGMRASGAYICPNHFAHLLHMVMLVSLGVVFSRGTTVPLKLFAGYTMLVCAYPLFLTLSRSGWIGICVGVVVFAIALASRTGIRKFVVVLVAVPLAVAALSVAVWVASPMARARVEQTLQGDIRIPLWQDSLGIVREGPWLGHGLGSYRHMFHAFHHDFPAERDPEFAHNDYLHYWCETGLVGLVLAALLFGSILVRAIRVLRRDDQPGDAALMSGLIAMLVGTAAHTFFDFNLNIYGNVHVLIFLTAALVAATGHKEVDRSLVVAGPSGRKGLVAGFVLLSGLLLAVVIYGRMTISYGLEMRGEAAALAEQWDPAMEQYRRAVSWAPDNWRARTGLAHAARVKAFWQRKPEVREPLIAEANRHYEAATLGNPWSAEAWYGFGVLARMSGEPDEALIRLTKARDLAPFQSFYRIELGHQLRNMRRYPEALAEFTTAQALAPTPIAASNIRILNRWIANRDKADADKSAP